MALVGWIGGEDKPAISNYIAMAAWPWGGMDIKKSGLSPRFLFSGISDFIQPNFIN